MKFKTKTCPIVYSGTKACGKPVSVKFGKAEVCADCYSDYGNSPTVTRQINNLNEGKTK